MADFLVCSEVFIPTLLPETHTLLLYIYFSFSIYQIH